MRMTALLIAILSSAIAALPALAGDEISFSQWLVIGPPSGGGGRQIIGPDPVGARYVLGGRAEFPRAGDAVAGHPAPWRIQAADDKGYVACPEMGNGYAFASFESDSDKAMLAQGSGHYYFFVNDEPYTGDVYQRSRGPVPVRVRKGTNGLLVRVVRGRFTLKLLPAPRAALLSDKDLTLPDVRAGEPLDALGAVIVMNASAQTLRAATIESGDETAFARVKTAIPPVPPFSTYKAPFRIRLKAPLPGGPDASEKIALPIALQHAGGSHSIEAQVRFRRAGSTFAETFVSEIDGSVQYYAVRPPSAPIAGKGALYLSLHGASVEATGQADAYSPKPDGWVVAATNRRPFGFDWEDWGRMDALEVLACAMRRFQIDPDRVYLAGHSMGGHGTWHSGVNHPGLFAAIGPSAGWVSFFSYGGARKTGGDGPSAILNRLLGHSDTLSLKRNLDGLPIFILHGDADDNVPVTEARTMAKELGEFHRDFILREFPGKGHWWDHSEAPGTDCVDLDEMFDFFARHKRPAAPRKLEFRTYNPWVSSEHRWVRIEAQERLLELSRIRVKAVRGVNRLEADCDNMTRFSIDPSSVFEPGEMKAKIGESDLSFCWDGAGRVHFELKPEGWAVSGPPPASVKNPARYGPFKAAFDKRFMLVYGTGGTTDENEAALARARFDAGTWWYRGNGAAEIVADSDFDPSAAAGRNVILYGHGQMNSAFKALLPDSPVRVSRGAVEVEGSTYEGDDIAVLLVRPSPLGDSNLVAVVGGTGAWGIRASARVSYIRSFSQFPDWFVFRLGTAAESTEGLLDLGLFDSDWGMQKAVRWKSGKAEEGF